jgi:putative ABC transport system permease protein
MMLAYYLKLALKSLRRNLVLTGLMIAAIGVGIGASMTTLTVFRAMAGDPIPARSRQLFVPQLDNWGPKNQDHSVDGDHLQPQLSYRDAVGLMNAHAAPRQAAMYSTGLALTPANPQLQPFLVRTRATYADFFTMFGVPFLFGSAWTAADDEGRASVVVISREINDKVFGGENSVGKTLRLGDHSYRVVGVIDHWEPLPKFYDLTSDDKFTKTEGLFLPFTQAIESQMQVWGNVSCKGTPGDGWDGLLHSECIWTQFWALLPSDADVVHYRTFLHNYAEDQRRAGRFDWPAHTQLRDVQQWLVYRHVVSTEVRILVLVSFSFLFVCLLNAMGLLLAKIMARSGEIGVRRALGANRRAVFVQCLIEAGVIGFAGGLLGLVLTLLGLLGLRTVLSENIARLTHLDLSDVGIALGLAVISTILAGLHPTWRAARVQPAWQLKAL